MLRESLLEITVLLCPRAIRSRISSSRSVSSTNSPGWFLLAADWPALYQRMRVDVAEGTTPEWLSRLLMRLFGRMLLGQPKSASDFAIGLDSDIGLDVLNKLPCIHQPTLAIGGDRSNSHLN